MKIAICDDDERICSTIENILAKYADEFRTPMDIDSFYSCEELIRELNNGEKYDLIYLDIEFPTHSGIDLGKFIREDSGDLFTEIVYMSGSDSYDRKLFSLQPLLFLAKPFSEKEVINAIDLAKIRSNTEKIYFYYNYGNSKNKIEVSKIMYFKSENRKIEIVTTDGSFEFYGKLDEVENSIKDGKFIRIHKSFLVNSAYIKELSLGEVILLNNSELSVSRSYRDAIKEIIMGEAETP